MNDTIYSVLRHREVGRAKDLSALPHTFSWERRVTELEVPASNLDAVDRLFLKRIFLCSRCLQASSGWLVYIGQNHFLPKLFFLFVIHFPSRLLLAYFGAIFLWNNRCKCMYHLPCCACLAFMCFVRLLRVAIISKNDINWLASLSSEIRTYFCVQFIWTPVFKGWNSIVNRLRVGRFGVRFPAGPRVISFPQNASFRPWGQSGILINGYCGAVWKVWSFLVLKLTSDPHLVPRLRMNGGIRLIPICLHDLDWDYFTFLHQSTE